VALAVPIPCIEGIEPSLPFNHMTKVSETMSRVWGEDDVRHAVELPVRAKVVLREEGGIWEV